MSRPRRPELADADKPYCISQYYRSEAADPFDKCQRFIEAFDDLDGDGILSAVHRVPLTSGLDREVVVDGGEPILCFDSNGYLGLHHHPAVKATVNAAVDRFGAGTPSVPLLGGTSHPVRALEEAVARFHGREDALIFSSAFAANIGMVPALVREHDAVVVDEHAHASLIAGVQRCRSRRVERFASNDVADLEAKLKAIRDDGHQGGLFVFADGVYSMRGQALRLPEVRACCDRYQARLIVDDCHGIGVFGATGRGVEEHFAMAGASDLLVGCFSKALGFVGGYVTGPRAVIQYLRYFTDSYVFSTSLPAPICAGVVHALQLIDDEPRWLATLHANAATMGEALASRGILPRATRQPIVALPIGGNLGLFRLGQDLLDAGLKLGVVAFPAVPESMGLLRMVVTARHTTDDIERAADILRTVFERHGLR